MALTKTYIKSKKKFKVAFELPVEANPENKEVRLLGQFNDWNWEEAPTLKKSKKTYKTTLELIPGNKYQFRYLVDQSFWLNDWSADEYIQSPLSLEDNCIVDLIDVPADQNTSSKKTAAKKATTTGTDFTKVEGIGPKISSLLKEAGIDSFEGLASMKKKELASILTAAGKRYQMHDPTSWPKQAKLIADGKTKALEKLQKELKGGKKK